MNNETELHDPLELSLQDRMNLSVKGYTKTLIAIGAGMATVIGELTVKDLIYIDSRTTPHTVGARLAQRRGLRNGQRDIFLDNKKDLEYITNKFIELVAIAKEEGSALAIGHPHSNTIEILSRFLKDIDKYGVKLIGIKSLIKKRKN